MATLIACTSGSWTEAATWKVANATAELDGETWTNYNEVAMSPSWSESSSFSFTGTIEVDAVAIKVRNRNTAATGTFSICIGQASTPVAGTTVTINASDIRFCATAGHNGWILFKFSSPVTLSASTNYTVMAQESSAGADIGLLTNGTAYNWLRQLRTTTTQAPTTGDKLIITGEWTAATTVTSISVTMNNNDTTDYGTGSTTVPSLNICDYGTLSFAHTTTTKLRLSGVFVIYAGGTLNIGTLTNPIGSSYTATLEFDCAANGDFGLIKYTHGILIMQGASRTYDRCMLAADAIQSATSITTSVSTGWKNGDAIAIAPTDRTATHSDYCILNGDASGTTLNLTSGLSWAHSSATLTQAEIIHLTRNIIITSVNSSYKGYTLANIASNITTTIGETNIDWVQFINLGSSVATDKNGGAPGGGSAIEISSIQYCSIVSCYSGIFSNGAFDNGNTISNNVGYNNMRLIHTYNSTTYGTPTISNNWEIGYTSPADGILISSHAGTISNNHVSGHTYGIFSTGGGAIGTCSDNVTHSNSTAGFRLNNSKGGTITNLKTWFNNYGLYVYNHWFRTTVDNLISYGNTTSNIYLLEASGMSECQFIGGSLNGYSNYDTANGINFNVHSLVTGVTFNGTSFGVVSGSLVAHIVSDIAFTDPLLTTKVKFYNCIWGVGTKFSGGSTQPYLAEYFKDNGTEGNDFSRVLNGLLIHNATAGENGGDCLEITPTGNAGYLDLSNYLYCNMFQCPAQDSVTRTVYIKLKKTATLDSTNVSLALYQNDTLVDGWDNVVSSLSDSAYTEFSLSYVPTEDGILDMAIKLDGDAGSLYVDSFRWT